MSTMTMRSAILPSLLVLALCAHFGLGLECYQCKLQWTRVEYPDGTVDEDGYSRADYHLCARQPLSTQTCWFGEVCYSEVYRAESDNLPKYPGAYVTEWGVFRGCVHWPLDKRCVHQGDLLDVNDTEVTVMFHPSSEVCVCEEDRCNTKVYDAISMISTAPSVRMSTAMLITAVVAYLGF